MFVKAELKAKLVQKEMNVESLATRIGMDKATLYRKMNIGNFSLDEVERIKDELVLNDEDVLSIFFAQAVSKSETDKEETA